MEQSKPAKPLSAYGLFFRDTVNAIKQQNPSCSFQELSKIVASMWDVLDPMHKEVYQKKAELAKMEYFKQFNIVEQQQEQLKTNASDGGNAKQQLMAQQTVNNAASSSTVTATTSQEMESNAQRSDPTEDDKICIRKNCTKPAIRSPDWEDEYCSNECVVIHCREVFNDWVRSNLEADEQNEEHIDPT